MESKGPRVFFVAQVRLQDVILAKFKLEERHLEIGDVSPDFLKYNPIGSMYGIFTYIYHKNQPNVGKYTIHGSYGNLHQFTI